MRISIQPSALSDLKEGYDFYEQQEPGLGNYFIDTLYSDIDSLQLYGGIHRTHFQRFHRLLSKRFPFAIYYQIGETDIFVNAILDLRRDPTWIVKRLKGL